jgi:hypothetical protein
MAARRTTERSAEIAAPLALVHALMSDAAMLVELHPLITRIDLTGERSVDGWHAVAFAVRESVPLGPLRVPNGYRGEIRVNPGDPSVVRISGWSFPGIAIVTEARLEALGP